MKTMRLVLPLLLVGLFGCDIEEPVNSKDFGPQPWPGWCKRSTYANGEYRSSSINIWQDGNLVRRDDFNAEDVRTACTYFSYREDGRLDEKRIDRFYCDGFVDDVIQYEWSDNGQLREAMYISYSINTGESYDIDKEVYTYGPDGELVHHEGGDWDPETETISVSYIIVSV